MRAEFDKLVKAERKRLRELFELRRLKVKMEQRVSPDPKMLKEIDLEIDRLLKG